MIYCISRVAYSDARNQPAVMAELIESATTLVCWAAIAVLASWLSNCSRNRQEQQAEIGAMRMQVDAMTVVVMELQGAAAANPAAAVLRLSPGVLLTGLCPIGQHVWC